MTKPEVDIPRWWPYLHGILFQNPRFKSIPEAGLAKISFIPVPVGRGPYTFIRQTGGGGGGCGGGGACKMNRVEGSTGVVSKRYILRPKLLWPTNRKWGVAHTVVVFFSRSRDPEVTFRGHVMFKVLI